MSKFDCFGDEQWIHEVLDFLVVDFERQQRFILWTQKKKSSDVGMIYK
jgi:hypothetical protein